MVILDDEADAASLNTKVNKKEISAINQLLRDIGKIPPSSIYIQVTATPQAILLQTKLSEWRPEIVHVFQPGREYRGGNDFYGENSFCIKTVPENEAEILLETDVIPSGLYDAMLFFLINTIYLIDFQGKEACNFLIHPGVKINHHKQTEDKISRILNEIVQGQK